MTALTSVLSILSLCPSFPCLQRIPTEINSFEILFFLPELLNEIYLELIN